LETLSGKREKKKALDFQNQAIFTFHFVIPVDHGSGIAGLCRVNIQRKDSLYNWALNPRSLAIFHFLPIPSPQAE